MLHSLFVKVKHKIHMKKQKLAFYLSAKSLSYFIHIYFIFMSQYASGLILREIKSMKVVYLLKSSQWKPQRSEDLYVGSKRRSNAHGHQS